MGNVTNVVLTYHHLLGTSSLDGRSLGSKSVPYPPILRAELDTLEVLFTPTVRNIYREWMTFIKAPNLKRVNLPQISTTLNIWNLLSKFLGICDVTGIKSVISSRYFSCSFKPWSTNRKRIRRITDKRRCFR